MLCPKCNNELNYEEVIDKCNKRINNKYITDIRLIYLCNNCNYCRLEFKKEITQTEIDI